MASKKKAGKRPKKKAVKAAAKKPKAVAAPAPVSLEDDELDAKPIPEDEELLFDRP